MTITEFSNTFDVLYDNLATKGSPGLDRYDKSVFLSKAQLEIVKNKYNPLGNKYKKGFEQNEQRRTDIRELIKDEKSTTKVNSTNKINDDSVLFKIPEDVLYIIFEEGQIASTEAWCEAGSYLDISPITHDEFKTSFKNPFKRPDRGNAFRLDLSEQDNNKVVEIYSEYPIDEYHFRYIKLPPPIILSNLDEEFVEEGLTIQGEKNESNCVLDPSIHQEILDRAIELAINYYKEGDIKSTVQLNTRNE